ncbi:MATE family efflux transporter [Chloroflexota bacterium]
MERRGLARRRTDRDWTKGSVIRNLLSLSWPAVVTQSLNMLGPTIDMIWVGKLGAAAIAGVGVSGMVVMMINSARMGLATGTRAMIARFIGTEDSEGANHVAQQTIVISSVFSIIIAAIGIFFTEPMLVLFGLEPEVVTEGVAYMRIMFVGSSAMSFRIMTEGIMQSSGDTVTPMRIAIGFRLIHAILVPFLIFGWWIFPRLGVSGAALTNVISQGLGLAVGLWFLFTGRTRVRLSLKNFHFDPNIIWRIVKIGIPASVSAVERTFTNLTLMWIITPFGTLAIAAHTIHQRVETILMMPSMAFGMAAGVLAGQNLGAGQPERAERTGWMAVGFAEAIMITGSVIILLWAESIISLFSTDPGVVKVGSDFLRISTAGYLVFGFLLVLMQCLNGIGDTLPAMLITLIGMWVVQLPLAFFLSRYTDIGVYGVRWALVIGIAMRAITYATYFRMGRWKRKEV